MTGKIFLISGFSDIEISGNQSMKNNIKYLADFGYNVHVFSFFSNFKKDNLKLRNPDVIFNANVEFHRLKGYISPILVAGRWIKNVLGRNHKNEADLNNPRKVVDYYEDSNIITRIFHIVFLFTLYLPMELLRVSFYSLRERPDIFYGVNWQGAIVASLLGRIFQKPIITRFHGTTLKEKDLHSVASKILLIDEIMALTAYSNAVIMTNDGTRGKQILQNLKVPEKKIYFWMNGLDKQDLNLPEKWDPEKFREAIGLKKNKIILMASRLVLWKRVDRGLYCVSELVSKYNMKDVILVIAGEGPDRERLERLAGKYGIGSNVVFLGGIPHEEMGKYFSIADVFMSLYDVSNLGNPVLEAVYYGVPVISINDSSTSPILENDYNALLVDIKRINDELSSKTKMLLNDMGLRRKMKENALITARKHLISWEERMKLENNLIKKLINN